MVIAGLSRTVRFLKERWIMLRTAIVLRADVIQVCPIREGVLGDDINVAPIKFLIFNRLFFVRNKAIAENHVGGTKTAGISPAEENSVFRHLRIQWLAIRAFEWRSEHIVAKPITKPVVALFIV